MNASPKLWLTSTSGPGEVENIREMIAPIQEWLDGVVWVLHDCPKDDPGAQYLESVKGAGMVIHRPWPRGRHFHSQNDTLWCGPMEEGDKVLFADPLERPMPAFVSRIQGEIGPMIDEAEVGLVLFYGKPFLFPYRETLEYRNSPHWTLTGWTGRPIEWSQLEPDEKQVRWNVRPLKRTVPNHWVAHLLRYWLAYPAGSNSAALGLDHFPPGDRNVQFVQRETQRLAFRDLMRARGYPRTVEGFVAMCKAGLDDQLKDALRAEKTLSDGYQWLVCGNAAVKDSHNPADAIFIP